MAYKSQGTLLKIGGDSVVDVLSIAGVGVSKEAKDVSNLADTTKQFLSTGLPDYGEITVSGFFKPSDTTGQKAMRDAAIAGTILAMSVYYVNIISEFTFNAVVTKFETGAEMEDTVPFEAILRTTGACAFGETASGGLSGLTMAGTGGTLSPAWGAAVRYYTFGGVTAASVTVTPTAASHTIKLYVDGVYTQDIVSGQASAAITMAIGTKKLTLIAYEAGKISQVTEIIVVKVS